jgi:hypothetical protein
MPHEISLLPAQKMDAANLWTAVCSCGGYQSSPGTEHQARKAGSDHASAMVEKETTAPPGVLTAFNGRARMCAGGCGLAAADGDVFCPGCREGHEANRTYDDPDRFGGP